MRVRVPLPAPQASIAQLAERTAHNGLVVGSSPTASTTFKEGRMQKQKAKMIGAADRVKLAHNRSIHPRVVDGRTMYPKVNTCKATKKC